jgi:hypothetical protein
VDDGSQAEFLEKVLALYLDDTHDSLLNIHALEDLLPLEDRLKSCSS